MDANERDRRRFLKESAALAGLTVAAIRSASGQALGPATSEAPPKDYPHAYGVRSHFENSARMEQDTPGAVLTPLQDLMGTITPASLHFQITHGDPIPDIDPRQHRLLIHGMVDRPLMFTVEELKNLPSVSRIYFLECAGNSDPTHYREAVAAKVAQDWTIREYGRTGCSEWAGVLLSLLLREAGVQKGASWVVAEGAEAGKHSKSIPLEKVMDDVLVAYGQNGEAVRPEQGYPLRLVVPGWEGNTNVKWLRRVKVVDQPYMTRRETGGYTTLRSDGKARWFQFEMAPKSVITRPSGGQTLPSRGFYEITGLAWSGSGAIRRVEVSTDGGRTWKDAQLQEPIHRMAHARFRFPWNWDGEEVVLQSRCTDELGQTQPTLVELAKFWDTSLDYIQKTTIHLQHFNAIQPWKVTREGSVRNAMF